MEGARAVSPGSSARPDADEIVFTKNATESLNLIAQSWGRANLAHRRRRRALPARTPRQHRAVADAGRPASGFEIRWIPVTPSTARSTSTTSTPCSTGAAVVSVTAMSNVTGAITDLDPIVAAARRAGAVVSVDACQLVPHAAVDVAAMGVDFVAFSGHKMCGPTGIGVLWARTELLEAMPPFLGGGGMIETRDHRGIHHRPAAPQVRGRHATDRRDRRPGRRRRLPRLRSAWTPSGSTRSR